VPCTSPSEPSHVPNSRQALSPSDDVPVSFGDELSGLLSSEAGDDHRTARDRGE
jgi:hypothetical protein